MRLLGHNTMLFQGEISLYEAEKQYPECFAVVLDPVRNGTLATSGSVRAVSKTRDGAFRALYQLGGTNRKVTVLQLP